MTEINITKFFNEGTFIDYSASVAEVGHGAACDTWTASLEAVEDTNMLSTVEQLEAMQDWARSTGAWVEGQITFWSDRELNALFIQLIAGDVRGCSLERGDWKEYEKESKAGNCSSNIFKADDGEIYYELGE